MRELFLDAFDDHIFLEGQGSYLPCAHLPESPAAVVVDYKMLMEPKDSCLTEVRKKVNF